jgi:hypothetical protein
MNRDAIESTRNEKKQYTEGVVALGKDDDDDEDEEPNPFSGDWYYPMSLPSLSVKWTEELNDQLALDAPTVSCLDYIGRAYVDMSMAHEYVQSIYYIALSEKNKVLWYDLCEKQKKLEEMHTQLSTARTNQSLKKIANLPLELKGDITTIVRDHVWPHIKNMVDKASEEVAFKLYMKNCKYYAMEEVKKRETAVVRYIRQLINKNRSNTKRRLAIEYTSKLILKLC